MTPHTHHWLTALAHTVLRWRCLTLSSEEEACVRKAEAVLPPLPERVFLSCLGPIFRKEWAHPTRSHYQQVTGWDQAEDVLLGGGALLLSCSTGSPLYQKTKDELDTETSDLHHALQAWIRAWQQKVALWPASPHTSSAAQALEQRLLRLHGDTGLSGTGFLAHRLAHALEPETRARTPPRARV